MAFGVVCDMALDVTLDVALDMAFGVVCDMALDVTLDDAHAVAVIINNNNNAGNNRLCNRIIEQVRLVGIGFGIGAGIGIGIDIRSQFDIGFVIMPVLVKSIAFFSISIVRFGISLHNRWDGNLMAGGLRAERIRRLVVDNPEEYYEVIHDEELLLKENRSNP